MKHLIIAVLAMVIALTSTVGAKASVWHSVNYDKETVAAMVAAFATESAMESRYAETAREILDRYTDAEISAALIFASKFLERRARTELGIWASKDENMYYERIYNLVSSKLMPKIWTVGGMMLRSPQTALYWGSYLFKTCQEIEMLCIQFETIVTNSTLSFKDIDFLQISPELHGLFNLAKGGNIDWGKLFDEFGSIPDNFTKESLQADLDLLVSLGLGMANSGSENMTDKLLGGNSFTDIVNGNIPAIIQAIDGSYSFYKDLDSNMKGTLLDLVGGPDAVDKLFNVSQYNVGAWLSDYAKEAMGQYYTQVWQIVRKDAGSEVICDYKPPSDMNSVVNSDEWMKFNTPDPGFFPSTNQHIRARTNSEGYAGWNQEKVAELNASQSEFVYTIDYVRLEKVIKNGGTQIAKAYAFEITVKKTWNVYSVAFEEVFDSFTMDLNTFMNMLNAKLEDLNDNENGWVYEIEAKDKRYYQTTDAAKIAGAESVIISAACHGSATVLEGTTQYKCKKCGSSLNDHTKECAMLTSVTESDLDTSEIDAKIAELQADISATEAEIKALEKTNQDLLKQINNASAADVGALREKYEANLKAIEDLKNQLSEQKRMLSQAQQAKGELQEGETVQTDDHYRIPAVMNDCRAAFGLTWTDSGSWNGFEFTRQATSTGMRGIITFTATLKMERKPKYFLGIKIHRAIIRIDWKLTSEWADDQVVDVVHLDSSMSDQEKADLVNGRLSEVAQDFPECDISVEYIKTDGMDEDKTNDVYHLLWSSDRMEIARQVEARLSHIYADLVTLEKLMHYKLSIIDALKMALPYVNEMQGKKETIVDEAFRRWMENADLRNKWSRNGDKD